MNAMLRNLRRSAELIAASVHAETALEPWPIASTPDFGNGVLMSDGSIKTFRSYGRAMSFIEKNPAPTARQQLEGALLAEEIERAAYRWDEETNDRDNEPAEDF